jgi:hypothetical protein
MEIELKVTNLIERYNFEVQCSTHNLRKSSYITDDGPVLSEHVVSVHENMLIRAIICEDALKTTVCVSSDMQMSLSFSNFI